MNKILALLLIAGSTIALSACGAIPTCNQELNECDRGGAYTEEKTIQAGRYKTVLNKKPEPVVQPAPAPVMAPEPMPEPAPIVDTQIMRNAEPEFKQISK